MYIYFYIKLQHRIGLEISETFCRFVLQPLGLICYLDLSMKRERVSKWKWIVTQFVIAVLNCFNFFFYIFTYTVKLTKPVGFNQITKYQYICLQFVLQYFTLLPFHLRINESIFKIQCSISILKYELNINFKQKKLKSVIKKSHIAKKVVQNVRI